MTEERGSRRMIEERMGTRVAISEADVQRLIDLSRDEGVKIVDWMDLGTPNPEVISGIFQVDPARASSVVSRLLETNGRLVVKVFPRGIPFPDVLDIDFLLRGQPG
jgi:hypothetical protein